MKSKHEKILKIFGISLGILLVLISIFAIIIWYEFFDITGLEFYDDTKIERIYHYDSNVYFITEDGKGYLAGNYASTNSRKYRNVESYQHDALNMPPPVLFWDGVIKEFYPYDRQTALFITEEHTLYKLADIDVIKLADSVLYAEHTYQSVNNDMIYYIDTENRLWLIKEEQVPIYIISDVKQIEAYQDSAWVITNDGDLCKVISSDEGYFLSEAIFQNAVDFDIIDTSMRYENEIGFYHEEGLEHQLWNVLTEDGKLYAKGAYNLLGTPYLLSESIPSPITIDQWTVIGENVEQISVAQMGTVMKFQNGGCAYYGFDTHFSAKSKFEYKELPIDDAVFVYASELCVQVEDSQGKHYFWGDETTAMIGYFGVRSDILSNNEPLIFDYPS